MKINLRNYKKLHDSVFEEDITFPQEKIDSAQTIKDIRETHAKCHILDYGEVVRVEVDIVSKVIVTCAYTLEPIEYPVHIEDELDFTFEETDDENLIYVNQNEIDMDDYIFGLILTEIPMKVTKKGASLPKDGKGYEVITEEEYFKNKEEQGDPRFSALDDLDLDDK